MDVVTIAEAAKMLKLTRQGVYYLIKKDYLTPVTILGKLGLPLEQVRAFASKRAAKKAA